jgi:hypothetical protein
MKIILNYTPCAAGVCMSVDVFSGKTIGRSIETCPKIRKYKININQ